MPSGEGVGVATVVGGAVAAAGGSGPPTLAGAAVAGVAVGALAALVGSAALGRLRDRRGGGPGRPGDPGEAGAAFLEAIGDCDRIAVLTHPNPDPDALASGMALVLVAEWAGVDATLQYPGEIRHQENRAFRRVLGVDCERIDHVSDLAAEAVVLVDHAEPRGFAGAEGVLPRAVVDHHPDDGEGRSFTDVRPNYGATASVVAGYCRELGARPVPPNRRASAVDADRTVPTRVATALLFAILTDTDRFTAGASAADFDAAGYLHPGVDETRLERVADPQVSAAVLETRARAVADREVRGPFAVSHVADAANADAIPQAADELVRIEGLTAAVVCGRVDDRVYLSGRSRDERVHMGRVLEAAVDGYGDGGAGGHARMGGGQLAAAAVDRRVLAERLFEALEGAEAPSVCDPVDLTPRPEPGSGSGPDPRGRSRGAAPGADPAPGGAGDPGATGVGSPDGDAPIE